MFIKQSIEKRFFDLVQLIQSTSPLLKKEIVYVIAGASLGLAVNLIAKLYVRAHSKDFENDLLFEKPKKRIWYARYLKKIIKLRGGEITFLKVAIQVAASLGKTALETVAVYSLASIFTGALGGLLIFTKNHSSVLE